MYNCTSLPLSICKKGSPCSLKCIYFPGNMDEYISDWYFDLNRDKAVRGSGGNKLRTYNTYKLCYDTEHYVKTLSTRTQRSALAKFRCGTAPIRIETGRFEGLALENRTCIHCVDCIESESHVILYCEL